MTFRRLRFIILKIEGKSIARIKTKAELTMRLKEWIMPSLDNDKIRTHPAKIKIMLTQVKYQRENKEVRECKAV